MFLGERERKRKLESESERERDRGERRKKETIQKGMRKIEGVEMPIFFILIDILKLTLYCCSTVLCTRVHVTVHQTVYCFSFLMLNTQQY